MRAFTNFLSVIPTKNFIEVKICKTIFKNFFIQTYFALKWVLIKILGKIAKKAFANFLLANPRKKIIETKSFENKFKILLIHVGFDLKWILRPILVEKVNLID